MSIQELESLRDSYYQYQREIIDAIYKNDMNTASSKAIQIAYTLSELCDVARFIDDADLKRYSTICKPPINTPHICYEPSIIDKTEVIQFLVSIDVFLEHEKNGIEQEKSIPSEKKGYKASDFKEEDQGKTWITTAESKNGRNGEVFTTVVPCKLYKIFKEVYTQQKDADDGTITRAIRQGVYSEIILNVISKIDRENNTVNFSQIYAIPYKSKHAKVVELLKKIK